MVDAETIGSSDRGHEGCALKERGGECIPGTVCQSQQSAADLSLVNCVCLFVKFSRGYISVVNNMPEQGVAIHRRISFVGAQSSCPAAIEIPQGKVCIGDVTNNVCDSGHEDTNERAVIQPWSPSRSQSSWAWPLTHEFPST